LKASKALFNKQHVPKNTFTEFTFGVFCGTGIGVVDFTGPSLQSASFLDDIEWGSIDHHK
jgi:hypothetical protein